VGNWGFKSTHCSSAYPTPSKEVQSCRGGGSCTTSTQGREGKGGRGKQRSSGEAGKGSYGAGFSVGT
jgi:hypothetical protein